MLLANAAFSMLSSLAMALFWKTIARMLNLSKPLRSLIRSRVRLWPWGLLGVGVRIDF